MAERVISGVKVPLIGDDEKLHRAINRSIDDLTKLKATIASTGVATAKQSREVMVLEERISSMVKTQEKNVATSNSVTAAMGKMRGNVSAVAGAMGGLAGSIGSAGGAIGKFGSIGAQAFGAFAVGGPIGIGLLAVGAAAAFAAEGYAKIKEDAEKARVAVEKLNAAFADQAKSGRESLATAKEKLAGFGKSSTETSIASASGNQSAAMSLSMSVNRELEALSARRRDIMIEMNTLAGSQVSTDVAAHFQLQLQLNTLNEQITSRRVVADTAKAIKQTTTEELAVLNQLLKLEKDKEALDKKTKAIAEWKVKHAKELEEINKSNVRLAKEEWEYWLKMQTGKIDTRTQVSADEFDFLLGRSGAHTGDFRSNGSGVGIDARGRTEISKEEFDKMALRSNGEHFAKGALTAFASGGGVSAVAASVAGPIAGQVIGGVLSMLEKISDSIASAVSKVAETLGKGVDFVLGSSKFGGLGSTGAQVLAGGAGVLAPAATGVGIMTLVNAPALTIAGPVGVAAAGVAAAPIAVGAAGFGAAAGGAMLADMLMRATLETKSYAKAMAAMNGIFNSAVQMMEPVFDSFLPSIGLVGMLFRNLAQTLAPMNAALGDAMGDALFGTFKAVAMTGIQVALMFDGLHINMMKAANAVNWFIYGLQVLAEGPGGENAMATKALYDAGVNALNTQISRDAELRALFDEVSGMVPQDGYELADAFSRIGEEGDTLADGFSAVSSSMRNIPDFFNAAAARRRAGGGGSDGGGPTGTHLPGPSSSGGNRDEIADVSVAAGGVYVEQMHVQANNPMMLAQQMTYSSYVRGSRPRGAYQNSRIPTTSDF